MVQGQQGQDNASATEMMNLRKTVIPQAEEVNEANSELIKICMILQMPVVIIQ